MRNLNFNRCEEDFKKWWNNLAPTYKDKEYDDLSFCDLLKLKELVKNVNNVATYRLTLAFVGWLLEVGIINQNDAGMMIKNISSQNPNAQGYDVVYQMSLNGKSGIIAEVKCNIPISINNLGAQKTIEIDNDIDGLLNGKASANLDPTNYYKFMVMMSGALSPIITHLHNKYGNLIYICDGKKPIWCKDVNKVNIVPISVRCDFPDLETCKEPEKTNAVKKNASNSGKNIPKIIGWDIEDLLDILRKKGLLKESEISE